jgi:hypothetical protein
MVFIIGVDHLIQYNGPVPEELRAEFKEYVVSCSRHHLIELIAEEFSREALINVYHASKDTALEASEILDIPHLYCDLEEADMKALGIPYFADILETVRNKLGISESFILDDTLRSRVRAEVIRVSKSYWHVREAFWYDKLSPAIRANILFVCGHEHTHRFQSLLHSKGISCNVLDQFWRSEIFQDYAKINLD